MAGKNSAKKFIRRLSIAIFLGILIIPPAVWGIYKLAGIKEPSVMEALEFDLGENREPAPFPQEINLSSITSELESYYNDHVPFRSVIITLNRRINSKLERAYSSQIQPVLVALMKNKHTGSNNGGSSSISETEPSGEVQVSEKSTSEKLPDGTKMPDETDGTNKAGGINKAEGTDETEGTNEAEGINEAEGTNEAEGINEAEGTNKTEGTNETEGINETGENQDSGLAEGEKESGLETSGVDNTDILEAADAGDTINTGSSEDEAQSTSYENTDASYFPPRELNGTIFGRDDWMFCNYDNSIGYYCGSNIMTEQQMKDKLSLMLKLQQICDSKGIQLQFMIAPNKEQVYSEYMPSYNVETTYKREQRFVDYVKQNSEVKIIYPLNELKDAKNDMTTYFKYDTHWNHYGAFIGTQALYEDMGLEISDISNFEIQKSFCVWGLVIKAGLSWQDYERDYNYVLQYKPEVRMLETYGDIDITHAEKGAVYRAKSTAERDCNFAMVGDSFRLYMVPYLERDFANVSIAHRNNIEDIREDILAADILVIECVERLDDSLNGTLLQIIGIFEEEE